MYKSFKTYHVIISDIGDII